MALRCRIRYSFEIVKTSRGSGKGGILYTPTRTAILICWNWTATTTASGSMRGTITLTISGIAGMSSCSSRRKSPYFSPVRLLADSGEFCFWSWPFQPPSILPTVSISLERAAYLVVSRDLDSQTIISNILIVSIFLIASLTQGIFSDLDKKLAAAIASIAWIKRSSILRPRE